MDTTGDADLASMTPPPSPTASSSTPPNNLHTLPSQTPTDEIKAAATKETTAAPGQQTALNNDGTSAAAAATATNFEPQTHTSTTTLLNNANNNNANDSNNQHHHHHHRRQQQQQQPQSLPSASTSSSSPLRVMICSANIGNAQPDAMSIGSWIPNDGDISNIIKNTDYPIRDVDYDDILLEEGGGDGDDGRRRQNNFDIIAIGMQEATFVTDTPVIATGIPKTKSPFVNRAISNADQTLNIVAKGIEKKIANPLLNIGAYKDHTNTLRTTHANNNNANNNAADKINTTNLTTAPIIQTATRPAGIFGGTEEIHRLIMGRNPSYECPVHFQRGGIRLMVLVRNCLVGEVSEVECRAETTGIGKVLANKGGIAVNLTIRNTRMTFVTCHLEAHEGLSHYKARCDNLEWILDGAKLGPSPRRFDVSLRSHHCFIFGDLNFRILRPEKKKEKKRHYNNHHQVPPILQPDDNNDPPSSSSSSEDDKKKHEFAFQTILSQIENKHWSRLNDADELSNAIKKGDCLADFQTLPCDFPPTFKVKRGEDDLIYNPKRIPSYTDRIVWKSVDDLESNVKPFIYEPCMSFISSDHKPIRGAFAIYPNQICTPTTNNNHQAHITTHNQPRKFHILVDNIKCTNLTMPRTLITDLSSSTSGQQLPKCNPFVTLITTPTTLTIKEKKQHKFTTFIKLFHSTDTKREHKGYPRTRILMKQNNPDWGPYEVHLQTNASQRSELAGALLHLTVMHYEPVGMEEQIIGTVTINLNRDSLASDDGSMRTLEVVDRPVMNNGIVRGRMECSVMAWWLFDQGKGGRKMFGETRRSVMKKTKGQSLSRRMLNKFGIL